MNRYLLITIIALLSFSNSYSQLSNGSVAPDFTLTDINGTTHTLYNYTDAGYTVFIQFSAVWCGPCWSYHQTGALDNLYQNHGPSGMPNVSATTTNDVMVIFIEGDANTVANLGGSGGGTQGDWITGTSYPIICTDGTVNNDDITTAYSIGYWPTIYKVCPDRILTEAGQTQTPYSLVTSCIPPPSSYCNYQNAIWCEDFGGGFPSGWSTYTNNTGAGNNGPAIPANTATCPWKYSTQGSWGYWNGVGTNSSGDPTGPDTAISSTTSYNGFLISDPDSANHWNGNPGSSSGSSYHYIESYFTTSSIDLTGHSNVSLEFEHSFRFNNSVDLVVSISSDSVTWTDYNVQGNASNNQASADPEYVSLNISSVAGNQASVYVKIGWTARVYSWMIDDMRIVATPDNRLSLLDSEYGGWWIGYQTAGGLGMEYTYNPLKQITANPYTFEGMVTNSGALNQNAQLNVDVFDNLGSSVFSTTSADSIITPQDTMTFIGNNTFAPTSIGQYHFQTWASSIDTISDTIFKSSIVTDSVYARDDGTDYSEYGLGRSCGGMVIGTYFDIYDTDDVTSLSVFIKDNSVAGASVYAIIYEVDPTGSPIYLFQSDDYTLTSNDIGGWATISFSSSETLVAGTYMAAIGGYANPVDTSVIGMSQYTYSSTCYIQKNGCLNTGQTFGDWYWTSRVPMIRMNFGNNNTNIYGCTDPTATNYDPSATMDDGSCIYCNINAVDTFNYTGAMQTYTVPAGVTSVTIEAYGAQGGNATPLFGGLGATMQGDFVVTPGQQLDILVGEQPNSNGGGGGTFVVENGTNTRLIIAGGGGGAAGDCCSAPADGMPGVSTQSGTVGNYVGCTLGIAGTGGNGGGGGDSLNYGSGGGGGFYTSGGNVSPFTNGGKSYLLGGNGGIGQTNGGYGGGGGTGDNLGMYNYSSGGGGGGYSGGGGNCGSSDWGNGGGGGSYNVGTNQNNTSGVQTGNGLVIISYSQGGGCTGCTDSTALNYDSLALYDDGSCCYVSGCIDPIANNYNPIACFDDGSCTYNYGCTDTAAANYDPAATMDDGSCIYCNSNSYQVTNITFAPEAISGTPISLYDDDVQGPFPIGFTFQFYGNNYTDFYVGSNGWIGFSSGQPTALSAIPIPDSTGYVPRDCIMLSWQDLNPSSGGQVLYQTIGTSPNRKMVLTFDNVPYYATSIDITSQVVLSEGSNIIDNHIIDKPLHTVNAVQGIHNLLGTSATVVPGRNATIWSANQESVRYSYSQGGGCTGCTDSTALNYDSLALYDDGSCIICDLTTSVIVMNATDSISCDGYAFVNSTSSNTPITFNWYDDSGTLILSGMNFISNLCYGMYTVEIIDNVGCVVVDTFIIGDLYGCTNPLACNYDPYANIDDGSCLTSYGCTDPTACNYDANVTCDDGTCLTSYGCTNPLACNYDSTATCNDGSCDTIYGCTNSTACNYDPLATCNDGSCHFLYGCTDPIAYNYDSTSICNDGSCLYCDLSISFMVMQNSSPSACDGWAFVNASTSNGPITYSWSTGSTQNNVIGLCSGSYTLTVTDAVGCTFDTTFTIGSVPIYGCTDSTATNYDPLATIDDGSCIYPNTCGPITGVNLTDVIHDRATFNWDDMNSATCNVDQIRFRYRAVGTNSWSTKTMGVPTGSGCNTSNMSKLVLGLSPSTTYEYDFKIWYCNASTVNWHANGSFTTLPLCDNVINIIPTPITTTKTEFCWDTVSTYAFVRLKYREDIPGSSFSNIGGMGVFSPTLCKDKNGLTPGLTYRVMWRTWCNPSGGPYRSPQWDGPVTWTQPNSIRVDELSSINSLEVYPNPSRDVFNVEFTSKMKQSIEVRLVNLVGEIIFTENLVDFEGEYNHSFNLSEYSKGIYLLELDTDNGIVNKKLILQ